MYCFCHSVEAGFNHRQLILWYSSKPWTVDSTLKFQVKVASSFTCEVAPLVCHGSCVMRLWRVETFCGFDWNIQEGVTWFSSSGWSDRVTTKGYTSWQIMHESVLYPGEKSLSLIFSVFHFKCFIKFVSCFSPINAKQWLRLFEITWLICYHNAVARSPCLWTKCKDKETH